MFGEVNGWERPNWFARGGVKPAYEYSYGRQNWFPCADFEAKNLMTNRVVFDQASFAKYSVEGRDACKVLNRICANDVDVPGRVVYTQWLNERGGIEADLTVTRLAEDKFLIVTGAVPQMRDFAWLKKHIPDDAHCVATDITSGLPMMAVMGPKSRALLEELSGADLSNAAFPFGASQEIEIGYARVRASRITYVGELGWELYMPTEFAAHVFETVMAAGEKFGLTPAGMHTMNNCRMEKAYRHWGHDIATKKRRWRQVSACCCMGQGRRLHRPRGAREAEGAEGAAQAAGVPRPQGQQRDCADDLSRGADLSEQRDCWFHNIRRLGAPRQSLARSRLCFQCRWRDQGLDREWHMGSGTCLETPCGAGSAFKLL